MYKALLNLIICNVYAANDFINNNGAMLSICTVVSQINQFSWRDYPGPNPNVRYKT